MFRLKLPLLSSVTAATLLCGGLIAGRAQEVLDGMAALVNQDVITFSQVRELVGAKEQAARAQLKGEQLVEKVKEIRLAALNDLINRQLILQEFKEMQKRGAQIPAHVLDEHVDTVVRESFGGDRSAFIRTLSAQGYSLDRFRQMEEEKIIVQALRGQHLGSTIIIPEPKIREYYQQHLEEYSTDEQIKLRMLTMKKSTGADDNRFKMMQEIRQKIVSGAAFGDLARMYTEDDSRQESGGDWGWVNRKTLNDKLAKGAFALKPGEVSPVLELVGNYYLLMCEAKKAANTRPFAEVRDEIEKILVQQERQHLQEAWLAKLRKKAFIKIF